MDKNNSRFIEYAILYFEKRFKFKTFDYSKNVYKIAVLKGNDGWCIVNRYISMVAVFSYILHLAVINFHYTANLNVRYKKFA